MPCGCVLLAYLGLSTIWDGLPRTLRFEINAWQNTSWGLHNVDRQFTRCEVAVGSDGSRANRCEREIFRHYIVPAGSGSERTLYLRPSNSGYSLNETTRTARGGSCGCSWEPTRMPARDDHECRQTAEARLPESRRIGTGLIAGHRVTRYGYVDGTGTHTELSLAPGLGCEVMEQVQTWPGTFGIPSSRWHYRVTHYQAGEPERKVFELPGTYTIRH